ncbi:hypothetical protein NQ317_012982 [Molorchus minor]|uniref:Uncharacterized protein n=1 Tax=Molorchus minor TaxID=1323400 RepID=A0ABQ9JG57_9CUCU|nr:hypothetical protein NQ317_012982 [Molorchus minor]
MSINSYQGYLELGACFCIFELSTGSSSELALCSPSISQGIMPDLTQGTFEFMEESLNELPSIRTLKCFSINTVRLWKPVLEHLKLQTESMDEDLYVKT